MKPKKLKIPKGIATSLLQDHKHLLKPVSVFLILKTFQKSGTIFDFQAKQNSICEKLFINDPRTLWKHIHKLMELKLVSFIGTTLVLCSIEKLKELLNTSDDNCHYVLYTTKCEHLLRLLAIKENFARQQKEVARKLKARIGNDQSVEPAQLEAMREVLMQRLVHEFQSTKLFTNTSIMPDISISQKKMAAKYNCKSSASGFYWQQLFKKKGLIDVCQRTIESETYNTKTRLGVVFWDPKERKKVCRMRNKINFFPSAKM